MVRGAKRTAAIGLVAAVGLVGPAFGAQTGGLAAPVGVGRLAVAATLGYVERDVEDGDRDEVSSRRMLFRAQAGLADGLDLYGVLGFADADFRDGSFSGSLRGAAALGAKYGLLSDEASGFRLVLDGQAEYAESKDGGEKVRQQTYAVSVYALKEIGAAGKVGYFYPYGGLRLSYARFDGKGGVDDYTGEDYLGLFAGADYFVNPNVFFTGEVHLFDATTIYLGVGHRF